MIGTSRSDVKRVLREAEKEYVQNEVKRKQRSSSTMEGHTELHIN